MSSLLKNKFAVDSHVDVKFILISSADCILSAFLWGKEGISLKQNWLFKTTAAILSLMLVLVGCAYAADSTTALPAGVYTGSATGYHGAINVEVTLDDTAITNVTVTSHGETEGIGTIALERLPAKIVETQSLALDAIAGCTLSSNGLLDAVLNALTTAGVDTQRFMEAPVEVSESNEIEKTADVIVVGGGGAGLSAALSATEKGASVIVVEKTAMLGGTTLMSGAYYSTGNQEISKKAEMNDKMRADVTAYLSLEPVDDFMARWQSTVKEQYDAYLASGETYMFDSEEYHMLQTYADGQYKGDPALIERVASVSRACYDWLAENGLPWSDAVLTSKASDTGVVLPDARRCRRNKSESDERHSAKLIHVMEQGIKDSGMPYEFLMEVRGEELMVENGSVVGVIATGSDGTIYRLHANKGVILATGGFTANAEMCQEYNKLYPEIPNFIKSTNSTAATGDGITMALGAGASLFNMEYIEFVSHVNPETGSESTYVCAFNQPLINMEGKRFVNEDASESDVALTFLAQPGSKGYLIADANSVNIDENGLTEEGIPAEDLISSGIVFKADTLEELALQLNMDPNVLQNTIDTFNASCDSGTDEFGRALTPDMKIATAPFYANLTSPGMHHSMGGVHIDTETRVLDNNGQIIPGLYAAGEVAGGFHGSHRESGNAILEALAEGMIAGANAASR